MRDGTTSAQESLAANVPQGPSMPLSVLRPGDRAAVVAVLGGAQCRRRLAAMGIVPQATVRLVSGGLGGPAILEVHEGRVVVGRSMAHKVMVRPA